MCIFTEKRNYFSRFILLQINVLKTFEWNWNLQLICLWQSYRWIFSYKKLFKIEKVWGIFCIFYHSAFVQRSDKQKRVRTNFIVLTRGLILQVNHVNSYFIAQNAGTSIIMHNQGSGKFECWLAKKSSQYEKKGLKLVRLRW